MNAAPGRTLTDGVVLPRPTVFRRIPAFRAASFADTASIPAFDTPSENTTMPDSVRAISEFLRPCATSSSTAFSRAVSEETSGVSSARLSAAVSAGKEMTSSTNCCQAGSVWNSTWFLLSSATKRAPGMSAAILRPSSNGTRASPRE